VAPWHLLRTSLFLGHLTCYCLPCLVRGQNSGRHAQGLGFVPHDHGSIQVRCPCLGPCLVPCQAPCLGSCHLACLGPCQVPCQGPACCLGEGPRRTRCICSGHGQRGPCHVARAPASQRSGSQAPFAPCRSSSFHPLSLQGTSSSSARHRASTAVAAVAAEGAVVDVLVTA